MYMTLDGRFGVTRFDPSSGLPIIYAESVLVDDDQVDPILALAGDQSPPVHIIVSTVPITYNPLPGEPADGFVTETELVTALSNTVQTVAQTLTSGQREQARTNIGVEELAPAQWVTPEQFATGSDAGDIQAALSHGASSTDQTVIVLQAGKTYDLGTSTVAWDSATGFLTVLAYGATIQSEAVGSAITELTHTGGNNPPRTRWIAGTYNSSTCAKFFDCVDVRSSTWKDCTFGVTAGIAVSLLNVNSFCERNEILDCYDNGSQQIAVLERGFKSTTQAVTFTTGTNQVTQTAHGFQSGDWCKFATTGASGVTINQVYYVATVPDADHYTINSKQCDAFGNFDAAFAVTIPTTSAGTAYVLAAGSFARTRIERLHITGGVYGFAKVEFNNCGPYDSRIGPFSGNISNGVGCVDFLNSRSQGNSNLGPMLVEASDDGKTVTGLASTNVLTLTNGAPVSRPLAVGQAVQLSKVVGGTGVSWTSTVAGLTVDQTFFIKTLPTATTFTLSATPGGATLALGTDVTAGFFWNTRPWKYRWGQSSGQSPTLDEPNTLRSLALYDPAQFNAGTNVRSLPDGTLTVWQQQRVAGLTATNSKKQSGVDIGTVQPVPAAPLNPAIYLSDGSTIDTAGALVIQAQSTKGLYLLDGAGAVLLGVSHSGALVGSAITAAGTPAGAVLTEAVIDFTSTKPDITTTSTSAHDITADVLALGTPWAGVVAGSLDCSFVAPANGIVRVEMEAALSISGTGSAMQYSISDVTGTPAAVANSLLNIFQSASTTKIRPRYSRKFSGLTPGQTYVWRPQWNTGGALTATMSCGAQNGPVRMSVFAWK